MSLKITIEVDGQTEQQLAPLVSQLAARPPRWSGMADEDASNLSDDRPVTRDDSSALLQQHIQQLTAQNQQLQTLLSNSQRLLAGTPTAKALAQASDSTQPISDKGLAKDTSASSSPPSEPPVLPMQYQMRHRHLAAWRMGRSLSKLPAQLWRTLRWRSPKTKRLLLFLLMCGFTYALLAEIPRLQEQFWPTPEFVDSNGSGPGDAAPAKSDSEPEVIQPNRPPAQTSPSSSTSPSSPTSKAGSHPPPPPAFQQP